MKSMRSVFAVIVLYLFGILSPYFIPVMNQFDPHLGPIPFTVWWSIMLVAVFCVCLYVWSRKLWKNYDEEDK